MSVLNMRMLEVPPLGDCELSLLIEKDEKNLRKLKFSLRNFLTNKNPFEDLNLDGRHENGGSMQ